MTPPLADLPSFFYLLYINMPSYKKLQSKKRRLLKKSGTKRAYRKTKTRKLMRGGMPVSFNEYMSTGNFNNSTISSQAKEIAQQIFNKNAKLDDVVLKQLAQEEVNKGQLDKGDYETYFSK